MSLLHQDEALSLYEVEVGPYANRAYLLACRSTGDGALVDAPRGVERLLREAVGVWVRLILITHRHRDHWEGLEQARSLTGAAVACHPADAEALPRPPDFTLEDGDLVPVGRLALRVLHTPGHTPGSVCLLVGGSLFSGDTLFPGGPGRTESPQAFETILQSITQRLLPLPPETVVYPGHGPPTTIGRAREEYQEFARRPHPPDLCGDVLWREG